MSTTVPSPFDHPEQRAQLEAQLRNSPQLLEQIRLLPTDQQQATYDILFSRNNFLDATRLASRQFSPEQYSALESGRFGNLYRSVRDIAGSQGGWLSRVVTQRTYAPENIAAVVTQNTTDALSPGTLWGRFTERFNERGGFGSLSNFFQSVGELLDLGQYALRWALRSVTGEQPSFMSGGMQAMARDSLQQVAMRSAHELNAMGMTREMSLQVAQSVYTQGAQMAGVDIRNAPFPGMIAGLSSLGGAPRPTRTPGAAAVSIVMIPRGQEAAASPEFEQMLGVAPSLRDAGRMAPSASGHQTDSQGNPLASPTVQARRQMLSREEVFFLIREGRTDRPNPIYDQVVQSLRTAYHRSNEAGAALSEQDYVNSALRNLRGGRKPDFNPLFNQTFAELQQASANTQNGPLSRARLDDWMRTEGRNSPILAGLREKRPQGVGEMTEAELRQFTQTGRQISEEVRRDLVQRLQEREPSLSPEAAQRQVDMSLQRFRGVDDRIPIATTPQRNANEIGTGLPFPSDALLQRERQRLLATAQPQPRDVETVRGLVSDRLRIARANYTVAEIRGNEALQRSLNENERALYQQALQDTQRSPLAPVEGIARQAERTDPQTGQPVRPESLQWTTEIRDQISRLTVAEARYLSENAPNELLDALFRTPSRSARQVIEEALARDTGSGPENNRIVDVFYRSPQHVSSALAQIRGSAAFQPGAAPAPQPAPSREQNRGTPVGDATPLLDRAREAVAALTGTEISSQQSQGPVPQALPDARTAEAATAQRGSMG
jgi:hypothetical protein